MSTFYNLPEHDRYIYIDSSVEDVGAAINAADAALGSNPGTIEVAPGNYIVATQIVLSSNRVLKLGQGTYTPNFDDIFMFVRNNTVIEGDGWNTILFESSYSPSNQANIIIAGYDDYFLASPTNTNITVRNLQIQGGTGTLGDGARASLYFGNCTNCVADTIYFNKTHPIGADLGGGNTGLLHSQNCVVRNCFFYQVYAVSLAAVNATDFQFIDNYFLGSAAVTNSTYIDLEINDGYDLMRNFIISGNYIDCSTADMLGIRYGIDVIAYGTLPGPGIISNNIFLGGTPASPQHAFGIMIEPGENILVTGNNFQCYDTAAILIEGQNNVVSNNHMKFCGDHTVAIGTTNSQYLNNVIDNSAISEDANNGFGANFHENGGDYNTYVGNYIASQQLPTGEVVFKGSIDLLGANSQAIDNIIDGVKVTQRGAVAVLPNLISSAYTVALKDSVIFGDTTSTSFTIILPTATTSVGFQYALNTNAGRILTFKNVAAANEMLLLSHAGETVVNQRAIVVQPGQCITIQSDGTNWKLISDSNFLKTYIPLTQANVVNLELIKTSALSMVNFTTPAAGNFFAYIYWRVITATTNLGITLTYTDPSGAQTATVLAPATAQPVGSYACTGIYFNATSGSSVLVTATAGTANQVFVSASIMALNGSLAPTPLNISNCVCWLRSDLGVSTSGSRVTAWADQSGNLNGAFDPSTIGPTLQSSGTALGLPALVFNAVHALEWNLILKGAKTVIMVLKENVSPTTVLSFIYYQIVNNLSTGSCNSLEQIAAYYAATFGGVFLTNDDITSTPAPWLVYGGTSTQLSLAPHVLINTYSGAGAGVAANFAASVDGAAQSVTASGITTTAVAGALSSIGASYGGSGFVTHTGIQDEVYEIIVYERVLTVAEIEQIQGYIAMRYGLGA